MDELMSLREVRTPVRLRFGRRSDERAVPHIFPQEVNNGFLEKSINIYYKYMHCVRVVQISTSVM